MFYEYQLFILLLGSALTDYFTENDVLKSKICKFTAEDAEVRRENNF